jgi:NTP pyrophosphatase (non-canonical NTP hydrolase)
MHESFQARVQRWMLACFNPQIAADELERNDRFVEEALELVQAKGYSAERAHALVDYVFGRPVGEPAQEVGGVMVTLAALCSTAGLDMHEAGERELTRIEQPEIMEKIRRKQAAKPTGSALPVPQ